MKIWCSRFHGKFSYDVAVNKIYWDIIEEYISNWVKVLVLKKTQTSLKLIFWVKNSQKGFKKLYDHGPWITPMKDFMMVILLMIILIQICNSIKENIQHKLINCIILLIVSYFIHAYVLLLDIFSSEFHTLPIEL